MKVRFSQLFCVQIHLVRPKKVTGGGARLKQKQTKQEVTSQGELDRHLYHVQEASLFFPLVCVFMG